MKRRRASVGCPYSGFWRQKVNSLQTFETYARVTNSRVEQEACALKFLFDLMERDRERRIFTVFLYRPFHGKNTSTSTFTQPYTNCQRIYSISSALDVDWLVQEEWAAEAGTMAVSRKS